MSIISQRSETMCDGRIAPMGELRSGGKMAARGYKKRGPILLAKAKEALQQQETWIVDSFGMLIVPNLKVGSAIWKQLKGASYGRVTDANFQQWKADYKKWLADNDIDDDEDDDDDDLEEEEEEDEEVVDDADDEYDEEEYPIGEEEENLMFKVRPELEFNIEKEPWPPVWKPIEKSPQYLMGMIDRFVPEWALERLPDKKDSVFCFPFPPPHRRHRIRPPLDIHRTLKKFLKQIKESKGYDLEVRAPHFIESPLYMVPYLDDRHVVKHYHLTKVVKFALAQINKHARHARVGKCYEFLKFEKFVNTLSLKTRLLTFTVKEVAANDMDDHVKEDAANNVDDHVVKTIQATVYAPSCERFRLLEWRFKPDDA